MPDYWHNKENLRGSEKIVVKSYHNQLFPQLLNHSFVCSSQGNKIEHNKAANNKPTLHISIMQNSINQKKAVMD